MALGVHVARVPSSSHRPGDPALTMSSTFKPRSPGLGPSMQQVLNECTSGDHTGHRQGCDLKAHVGGIWKASPSDAFIQAQWAWG